MTPELFFERLVSWWKRFANLLVYNGKTLFAFECIYKFISAAVFVPVLYLSIGWVARLAGFSYVTSDNFWTFMRHPLIIAYAVVLLLVLSFYSMIDISAVIYIIDQADQKVKVGLLQPIRFACSRARHAFEPKNIMIAVVVLIMIPYLNCGILSSVVGSFSLPSFVERYIDSKTSLSILAVAAAVLVAFYLLRWLFGFHYYSLEKCDFNEARRRSLRLMQKYWLYDAIVIGLIQIVYFLISKIVSLAAFLALKLLNGLMTIYNWPATVLLTGILFFLVIMVMIFSTVAVPISYACISLMFYISKESLGEEIVRTKAEDMVVTDRMIRNGKRAVWISLLVSFAVVVGYIAGYARGQYAMHVESLGTVGVTAHRGSSSTYPENTMSAFYGAKAEDATCIELDVEQSKDGVIFVCHDSNLERITGEDVNCWELTYEEIRALDAGSFFSTLYREEYMPTLEEVIEFASTNNIDLNIELKPTGHETNLEQGVVDLIHKHNFANHCVVASQEYDVLSRVKAIDSNIMTIYVTTVAYGDVAAMDAADGYSIEATTITAGIVKKIHNAGKVVYAWTVNDQDEIQSMIDLGVDNIITDDVLTARKCIYGAEAYNLISKYLHVFTRDSLFAR